MGLGLIQVDRSLRTNIMTRRKQLSANFALVCLAKHRLNALNLNFFRNNLAIQGLLVRNVVHQALVNCPYVFVLLTQWLSFASHFLWLLFALLWTALLSIWFEGLN